MPRVLLVDDHEVNRDLLARRLTRKGYEVVTAADGETAVELARTAAPDVVLMDIGLPGIDGCEATRRIKTDPVSRAVPVVALSAHAQAEERERAHDAGCDGFEPKPVQFDALLARLEAIVGKATAQAPVAVVSPPPPAAVPVPPDPRPAEPTTVPLVRKKILVVEDNDANRVMLARRLARQGYLAVEARDGREALVAVRRERFDLVLLDLMMPEVDGYEVLVTMKADPDLRAVPVVMITALDETDSVAKCIEAGAEDYLTKPYDPVILQARLNACLDKRRERDEEREYLRAVSDLIAAATQIEEDRFDPAVLTGVAARDDELGGLGRVFARMAKEVVARERGLRQQIRQLEVRIDEDQKARRVSEITEDEYFGTLLAKLDKVKGRAGRRDRPADGAADTLPGGPPRGPTDRPPGRG